MSDKVAVVRRMYEMFGAGEIPQLIEEMMAPNVVMHIPGKTIGGDKVGHAGVGQFFQTLDERTDSVELDIHDVTESDEHVVVILNLHETRGAKRWTCRRRTYGTFTMERRWRCGSWSATRSPGTSSTRSRPTLFRSGRWAASWR